MNEASAHGETPRTGNFLAELIESVNDSCGLAEELREKLFPATTKFFGAARGALFMLGEVPDQARILNPVVAALLERHAPLHEGHVASEAQWSALGLRADHGHVLAGPTVFRGELVGVLAFTRFAAQEAFNEEDVANLSALCLHISTRMGSGAAPHFELSPREREIAALVAQGKTNAQIGRALHISGETVKAALKTLFRKTGARSRAQLVAVLAGSGGS